MYIQKGGFQNFPMNFWALMLSRLLPWWLTSKRILLQCRRHGSMGSIPGSGRCPGEENDNPLQYSCLGNPTDRGALWAMVHSVTRVRHDLATKPLLLLLLLLSRFSPVQLCATPQTAAHQAPPSLGFFRQEHWSGLPFPSPMHESEK